MSLITLTSDFGSRDHYVAALKIRLLKLCPKIPVLDISHDIEPFNLAHAAFVLNNVYRDCPEGTVHIVAINSLLSGDDHFIAIKLEGHYFVGADNGLFSLLSTQLPSAMVELSGYESFKGTFPGGEIFCPVASKLADGEDIFSLGQTIEGIRKMIHRYPHYSDNKLIGHIVHVDIYENLITNIDQKTFEGFGKQRTFVIAFGSERLLEIKTSYNDVPDGECVCVFNSGGFLEIAINKGKAAALLGLGFDKQVIIDFESATPEYEPKMSLHKIGKL